MGNTMFRHLLVPIDLSQRNTRALRTAGVLARQSPARVTLLHVIEPIAHIPVAELERFYARLEGSARRRLDAAAARLARSGVRARGVVVMGRPAAEIVRFAAAERVDLIVLRSHRVDPRRSGMGWGTTSYAVGIACRCPILLVK